MSLHVDEIDAIAQRVVELLDARTSRNALIDARDTARRLGVARAWVYAHARELGGVRLGEGARARLRFDPAVIDARLARLNRVEPAVAPAPVDRADPPQPSARARPRTAADVRLIRGRASRARRDTA